jgi:D-threo-aldose 1-dehydrogenase
MDLSQRRPLGRLALRVTPLGLGGAPLGDLYENIPEDRADATVRAAVEAGVGLFDTAPNYGYGLSEHRFGHVLRQAPRDTFVLSTKVGRWLRPEDPARIDRGLFKGGLNFAPVYDYSYDGAMRSFEQSLHRLGLDRVDVLLIHDVDVGTHGSPEAFERRFRETMDGAYRALDELRRAGAVRAIGIGVSEIRPCEMFAHAGDFDCFMLAGRYTLLEQEPLDGLLTLLERKGIGILLAGPFNSGVLATGAVAGAKYNYAPAPPEILDRVRRIEAVCRRHNVPLPAAAIQFPLAHPVVSSIVTGAAAPHEIARNVELITARVPTDLWAELKHAGLIRANAPVPS